MFPAFRNSGPFLAMRGPFITAAGSSGVTLSGAAATVSGTTITVTATSSGDLSEAVFGVEYSILDNGGSLTGYTFSKNVVGAVSSQSITVTAADGVTSDSTVTVRAYYNLDVLDDPSTRVYANDIAPYVVAGGVPSGTQTEGETLTQVQGVIAGSSPLTVTYQWQNDGGTGTWANINGATSATYELQASDVGDDVAVVHTGTNGAGADSTRSAETGAIASASISFSNLQAWSTPSLVTGTSVTKDFASAPTAGNLIVAFIECSNSTTITGVADSVGSMSLIGPYINTNNPNKLYLAWKQVTGTPTATITATAAGSANLVLCVAEYTTSAAGTIATDGTPTGKSGQTGAAPDVGNIITTAPAGLIIGATCARAPVAAGTDAGGHTYTEQREFLYFDTENIVDFFSVEAGTYNPTWTSANNAWASVGAAFKCT